MHMIHPSSIYDDINVKMVQSGINNLNGKINKGNIEKILKRLCCEAATNEDAKIGKRDCEAMNDAAFNVFLWKQN